MENHREDLTRVLFLGFLNLQFKWLKGLCHWHLKRIFIQQEVDVNCPEGPQLCISLTEYKMLKEAHHTERNTKETISENHCNDYIIFVKQVLRLVPTP
jgi:hypothetical protein